MAKNILYTSGTSVTLATGENYTLRDSEIFINGHVYKKEDVEIKINNNFAGAVPEQVGVGIRKRDGVNGLPADFSRYDEWYIDDVQQIDLTSCLANVSDSIESATSSSPFVKINEGNGDGIVVEGRTAANYGNVGLNAKDLSRSTGASSTKGATGADSLAANTDTTSSGDSATALGDGTQAPSFAEFAFGSYNTPYVPISATSWSLADRLLSAGIGTAVGLEKDAVIILKTGEVTLPSQTIAIIEAEPTGKAVLTKEWFEANASGGTYKTFFINSSIGNDLTGIIGDENKPFETIDGALAAIPSDDNYYTLRIVTDDTYEINSIIPARQIEFYSEYDCTISFANNLIVGDLIGSGATSVESLFFNVPDGTLLFTAVGSGAPDSVYFGLQKNSFFKINAKNVTISDEFDVRGTFREIDVNIETLDLEGVFFGLTTIKDKGRIVINKINSVAVFARLFNTTVNGNTQFTPLTIDLGEVNATSGFWIFGFNLINNGLNAYVHLRGDITVGGANNLILRGCDDLANENVFVWFYDITLDGNHWIKAAKRITLSGKVTIINNTQPYFFSDAGDNPTFDGLTFDYNGTGSILLATSGSSLRLKDSYVNISNATSYLVKGSILNDYTADPPLIVVDNFASIKHSVNGFNLYDRFAGSTNETMTVNGTLRTNAVNTNLITTNTLTNTY